MPVMCRALDGQTPSLVTTATSSPQPAKPREKKPSMQEGKWKVLFPMGQQLQPGMSTETGVDVSSVPVCRPSCTHTCTHAHTHMNTLPS